MPPMRTSEFDYELPPERIAQEPSARRDRARMMVVHRAEGRIEHRLVSDLPEYLRSGDVLVVNDTRVIAARLAGVKAKTGGKVELLLLEETGPGVWEVLLKASRRPKPGEEFLFSGGRIRAAFLEELGEGRARVRVESDGPLLDLLEQAGLPPLPPYIKRKDADAQRVEADREHYQTIFAKHPGAVAAPTAGLHFTPELLRKIEEQGVRRAAITLHVGAGTFRPVSAEQVEEHLMESERYIISPETAQEIQRAREEHRRVIAVGSTTVRLLETCMREKGRIEASSGRTSLFIYPPFEFRAVDAILTNFHLPRSSLLMMVSAFAGRDLIRKAYEEAIRENYRFYSYGDCMLML